MKKTALLVLRLILLTIFYFILFAVFSALLIPRLAQEPASAEQANVFLALVIVSFANTCALSYLILRSRLRSWTLILSIFVFFFGTSVVMPQIETAVFVTWLPAGMLTRIIVSGFCLSLVFPVIAVLVLGRHKGRGHHQGGSRSGIHLLDLFVRLTVIGICYVAIYFTFGYFIAWQSPAVRAYYHGSDPGSFITQLQSVFRETPWLFALQFLRGVIWALIALPVIRTLKGQRWETGIAVALCFAICTSSQLLIPNPFMPPAVRMAHLLETSTSNFLFGLVVIAMLWGRTLGPHSGTAGVPACMS
jgi:hypothetical protein